MRGAFLEPYPKIKHRAMEIPTPMKAPTGAITSKLSSIQSSINIFFPLSVSTPCAYKIILNY